MGDPYFRVNRERFDGSDGGGRYDAAPATAGPWDPRSQHGGPPSALLVRAAERQAAAATGRATWFACRIAVDFLSPVPVADGLEVRSQVIRAGRNAVLVETSLVAGDRQRLAGRVWLLAPSDTSEVAPPPDPAQPPAREPHFGFSFPYSDSIDWHEIAGSITVPGPAEVWARPRLPLVAGEELSSLQRAVLIGDSGNGISAVLDWNTWTFLNVDLDVHLARPLTGEWLHLSAATQLGASGTALARSTIGDVEGPAGAGAQTLLLVRRTAH